MENINHDELIGIMRRAAEAVMQVYHSDGDRGIEIKEDYSPVTLADKRSAHIIHDELEKSYPQIPIICEEFPFPDYSVRKKWKRYWLIDPLDGTKEFINKNGEFCILLALIEEGKPVLGLLHIPVQKSTYIAQKGKGAYRIGPDGIPESLPLSSSPKDDTIRIMMSRSHQSREEREFTEALQEKHRVEHISHGSAIKMAKIAEGSCDIYPKSASIFEWDTAAGQLLVEESGGAMLHWESKLPLSYGSSSMRVAPFYALSPKAIEKLQF